MAFTEITDHVNRALSRLKTVFQPSVEFRGVLTALALECQALETSILSVRNTIRNTANGADGNLDTMRRVANLVGARPIGSVLPADYEVLINAQIQVNKSQGSPEDMIEIYAALLEPWIGPLVAVLDSGGGPVTGCSGGPGALVLVGGTSAGDFVTLEQARNAMALLKSAAPAGNRVVATMAVSPALDTEDLFYADTSLCDSGDVPLCAFDSPSTVR